MNKLILIVFALLPVTVFAESEKWFLMSREGECAEISTLERKVEGATSINTPTGFVELMNKKGYKTAPVDLPGFDGEIVQVDVPKKGLYLIFVKEVHCKNAGKKSEGAASAPSSPNSPAKQEAQPK